MEGLNQALIAGEVGHDAHFDLRIICRQQAFRGRLGDKGRPNLVAHLCTDRDVLQIGIGRGQPAGAGARLVESSV